jgi:tetratricopeptide (TPR) repeat protein
LLQATIVEYEAREKDPKVTPEQRFTMLENAIKDFPDSIELLQKLVAFYRQEGEQGQKTREMFRDLIDTGRSSAVAHLVLGMDYWNREKPQDARYHWEKAFELYKGQDTNSALLVANNLAWVIAHQPPVELDRALGIIDAVIEKAPTEPRFRSTRGHILAKLGRHKEALPDLQEAKKAYPNDPNLFRQLSESCAHEGLERLATEYKRRADELDGKYAKPTGGRQVPPG